MVTWLAAAALGADVRLVVVGDTGEDTPVARMVAAEVERVARAGGVVQVVATGDLFYDRPPSELSLADCAEVLTARYRQFYAPGLAVLPVTGNHDVYPPGDGKAFSWAAHACTERAFRDMGWLPATEPLRTRVVRVDGGETTVDVVLVDWRLRGSSAEDRAARADRADLRRDATFRVGVSHYPLPEGLTTGKCKEFDWNWALPRTVPGRDLWLNGHSHHLEARQVRGALNVTSGGGKELDALEVCSDAPSFYRITAADPVPTPGGSGPAQGGYTVIDLGRDGGRATLRATPYACTLDAGCVAMTAVRCVRGPLGRRAGRCTTD